MAFASPVSKNGFHYSDSTLLAEASGHNRHRRATLPELEELFHPKSASSAVKDNTGHWYEAQLIHYGLPPSKSKAVAKTRLLDAVNKGGLTVPTHITKLENELKKEWTKKQKEAKAAFKSSGVAQPAMASSTKKRKLDSEDNIQKENLAAKKQKTDTMKSANAASKAAAKNTTIEAAKTIRAASKDRAAKKAKTETVKVKSTAEVATKETANKKKDMPKAKATNKAVPKKTSTKTANVAKTKAPAKPPTQASKPAGPSTTTSTGASSIKSAPRAKQYARRGGGWAGSAIGGHTRRSPPNYDHTLMYGNYDAPDLWFGDDSVKDEYFEDDNEDAMVDDSDDDASPKRELGRLGLINGTYALRCAALDDWSEYDGEDFNMILALEGDRVWGAYDFGMHSGILNLTRPFAASHDRIEFKWRGRENGEGEMTTGDNYGWMMFLGDGEIEGMISCYGEARFSGTRVSGAETRPARSARGMKEEFASYNEDAYERERIGRWGGSRW